LTPLCDAFTIDGSLARSGTTATADQPDSSLPEVAVMKGKVSSAPSIPKRCRPECVEPRRDGGGGDTGGKAFINGNDIAGAHVIWRDRIAADPHGRTAREVK
jgi:hypothetical protein